MMRVMLVRLAALSAFLLLPVGALPGQDSSSQERTLEPAPYSQAGSGHYIEEIRDEGVYVVLEDGSLWEVASDFRFRTVHWQPLEEITVRSYGRESYNGYSYELLNSERDEGAPANHMVVKR